MKLASLSIGQLSILNLKRRMFRTASLIVIVSVLAFTMFAGSIMTTSLNNGMDSMQQRFGADLMVVPKGDTDQAEGILLQGKTDYFYLDSSVAQKVAQVKGVTQATSQFFFASLSAACCTVPVQLIAFDPATDFVIQPWIGKTYTGAIGDGQLVVGSNITLEKNNTIKLFNHYFPVAARLAKSATGLDSSIFMTMDTMQTVLADASQVNQKFLSDGSTQGSVSAVLVKIDKKNYDANTVAAAIRYAASDADIDIIETQAMLKGVSDNLYSIVGYTNIFTAVFWLIAVVILAVVFSATINERKKEFAVFRILGATRKKLIGIVLLESLYISVAGGVLGAAVASIVVFPFSTYIGEQLQLPYLQPSIGAILAALALSLLLSFVVGPLASVYSAIRISKAETYITLREGE